MIFFCGKESKLTELISRRYALKVKRLILLFIRLYQHTLSLDHGVFGKVFGQRFCRFYPTCSEYAYQAIEKHGIIRGLKLGFWRISRCHPWNDGGDDPVL